MELNLESLSDHERRVLAKVQSMNIGPTTSVVPRSRNITFKAFHDDGLEVVYVDRTINILSGEETIKLWTVRKE